MIFPDRLLHWAMLLETAGENTKKQVHDEILAYYADLMREPEKDNGNVERAFEREFNDLK